MTQAQVWERVDDYVTERLIPRDAALEEALARNRREGLPAIDVSKPQGMLLQLWTRMLRARRILEIGTLGGYSTIWMAKALPENGRIVTLELEPHHAETARRNFEDAGVASLVELRVGDALTTLAALELEGTEPFDMIFIDADKPNNPHYLERALRLSRPGTVIVGDNVVRDGEVANGNSADPRVVGVRAFLDLIHDEPRLSATAIQTVGSKGYDGFVLAIVND